MQRELRPRFQFKSKENRKMLANAAFLLLIVKCAVSSQCYGFGIRLPAQRYEERFPDLSD